MKPKSKRGGLRNPPGGRPKLPTGQKREKHSPSLAPGIKELAQTIAEQEGYPGWGYVVDEAIMRLAKSLNVK